MSEQTLVERLQNHYGWQHPDLKIVRLEAAVHIEELEAVVKKIKAFAEDRSEAHIEAARQASVERDEAEDKRQCFLSNNWNRVVVMCYSTRAAAEDAAKEEVGT